MTRRPHLHALLTGEPTPTEKLVADFNETHEAIERAKGRHAVVVPLRSRLRTLAHLRLVERV